jgi:hypothetical protein
VGINHRSWDYAVSTRREAARLTEALAKSNRQAYMMGVSFNSNLPVQEQENLRQLNGRLQALFKERYISPIPEEEVFMMFDDHQRPNYSSETAKIILSEALRHVSGRQAKKN